MIVLRQVGFDAVVQVRFRDTGGAEQMRGHLRQCQMSADVLQNEAAHHVFHFARDAGHKIEEPSFPAKDQSRRGAHGIADYVIAAGNQRLVAVHLGQLAAVVAHKFFHVFEHRPVDIQRYVEKFSHGFLGNIVRRGAQAAGD